MVKIHKDNRDNRKKNKKYPLKKYSNIHILQRSFVMVMSSVEFISKRNTNLIQFYVKLIYNDRSNNGSYGKP